MNIICGMHRSGTSILCKILRDNNFDFGNQSSLIKGDKWNPSGYFEQNDIFNINELTIKRNHILSKLIYLFPGIIKKNILNSKYDESLREKITALRNHYHKKFVKDNRFCLTIPLWSNNIQSIVLCFRNPYEISSSLKKKYKLPIYLGLFIWRYHILNLIKNTKSTDKKFYFFYDNLKNKKSFENLLDNLSLFYFNEKNILKFDYKKITIYPSDDIKIEKYNKKYLLLWNLIKKKYFKYY